MSYKPKETEEYWYIDESSYIYSRRYYADEDECINHAKTGNMFETPIDADSYCDYLFERKNSVFPSLIDIKYADLILKYERSDIEIK